jgi:hypothetical protein
MATPVNESSFVTGEVAPALFGNVQLARMHSAAATMRNFWPRYSGGAYSRAGFAFVGFSKQTGRNVPPRLIPFQFSINQGLTLEFGNYYMRVVFDGGYVTENPFTITGISQANPAIVNFQSLSSGVSAVANNAVITSSYVRGDLITPAGGVVVTPAVMIVNSTTLAKLTLGAAGTGYVAGDTVTLLGGTPTLAPVLTVLTIGGGGSIATFAISNGGVFVLNGTGNFTQASTSGAGTGATFTGGLFGPKALTFQTPGGYTAVPANPANQGSTSGAGLGATYTIQWATPAALNNGDWVFIAGVNGMLPINSQSYVITNLAGSPTVGSFSLTDVFGATIDSTAFPAWTSGGTASRIFTLTTQYAEADLEWIKYTQSADVMSLCCVNQATGTEYQPLDLSRTSDTNWSFSAVVAVPSAKPPTAPAASASSAGAVAYAYEITSVASDGTESIASAVATVAAAVNIAATAGSITLSWTGVAGVNQYNIYKATPIIGAAVPAGVAFGFAGFSYGTQFVDSNIVADFAQVPPTHQNPFAQGPILGVLITGGGAGATFAATITSLTGSGAVLVPISVANALAAVLIMDGGQNYQAGDTIAFTNGATGTLVIGPESGTYPGTVSYFGQRRAYAYTLNQPDTYFMSQPGAFLNFDTRTPTIDTDAITGTPWSVQVNGIQFLIPITGGLIAMTGLEAYLLTGSGGSVFSPQPLTPASQQAQPEGFNGCAPTIPPIRIYQDIVYVQSKGSTYRDFAFQMSSYTFTGADITLNSSHLFNGFTIREHAWCEEPYKILWSVRSDGVLLSLTYMKSEQVQGWARHDTNGIFWSVASTTELPVDALYAAVQRQFGNGQMGYTVERMNNRLWTTVEDSWCVDCGFSMAQPAPNANLMASNATGLGAVTGVTNLVGGVGYSSATTATVFDAPIKPNGPTGPGVGAVAALTIVGGVITNVTFPVPGVGYHNPQLLIQDPAGSAGGSGASAQCVLDNSATFTADQPVFSVGNVGSVIRMGGGKATITQYLTPQTVIANITDPIAEVQANSGGRVQVQFPGSWTMTAPVTTVYGLRALAGMTVGGIADGNVITPFVVPANGVVTLSQPASQVTIGLKFRAQLQSVYLDAGEPTVQGQRGKISEVTARVEASGAFMIGSNQPDGSTLSPPEIAPQWTNLAPAPTNAVAQFNSVTTPLYTGDIRIPIQGGFQMPKQVAVEQSDPLPLQILAFIPSLYEGDNPAQTAPKRGQQG